MDSTDSTRPAGRGPDVDPAASSMPAIPTYWSETLGRRVTIPDEVVRERHDEAEESMSAVRDALLRVLRALDLGLVPEAIGTLRTLTYHEADYVPAVLRSLDALVEGAHGEGGERS